MTVMDSRQASVREEHPVYMTSEPQDSEWGQPAAARYILVVDGVRLHGQPIAGAYVPSADLLGFDDDVATELEGWDAASDEAFWNFEAMLD